MSIPIVVGLRQRSPARAIPAASAPIRAYRGVAVIGVVVALAFSTLGCSRPPKPPETTPPAPIKWEEARQLVLEEWTELVGSTQPLPDHAARVTSPIAGRVIAVLPGRSGKPIIEGQSVEAGEVLIRLDASAIGANLTKAEAAKKVLQAEREGALVAVKQASLEVKSLEELKRTSPTLPVSPIAMEKARLGVETAQAAVTALDRKIEAADKEEAALNLEIQLYTLTAPRKGALGRLQVVLGQTLPAGAPIAEIVDIDDEIDVLCFVAPADARKLQLGRPAHIGGFEKNTVADADPEGKVVYIADQAEAETGSFAVKIRFPNRDLKFRANAVARVRVQTKPDKLCLVCVPEAALMEDQDPPGILVVEEVATGKNAEGKDEQTGKIRRLRAKIGMRDRVKGYVEIVELYDDEKKWLGDKEHSLFVIAKGQGLQTGDAVKLEVEDDD